MKLSEKELDLMDKHDIDEIVFMHKKQRRVAYDIPVLMEKFQKESAALRRVALLQALQSED